MAKRSKKGKKNKDSQPQPDAVVEENNVEENNNEAESNAENNEITIDEEDLKQTVEVRLETPEEEEKLIDEEDLKETVEVDLGKLHEKEETEEVGKKISALDDRLKKISKSLSDLSEEQEEMFRRISMSIGDSQLALKTSDQSAKDLKSLKDQLDEFIQKAGKDFGETEGMAPADSNVIEKVEKLGNAIEEIHEKILHLPSSAEGAPSDLGERVSILEDLIDNAKAGREDLGDNIEIFKKDFYEMKEKLDEIMGRADTALEKEERLEKELGKVELVRTKMETLEEDLKKDLQERMDQIKSAFNTEELMKYNDVSHVRDMMNNFIRTFEEKIGANEDRFVELKTFLASNLDSFEFKFKSMREELDKRIKGVPVVEAVVEAVTEEKEETKAEEKAEVKEEIKEEVKEETPEEEVKEAPPVLPVQLPEINMEEFHAKVEDLRRQLEPSIEAVQEFLLEKLSGVEEKFDENNSRFVNIESNLDDINRKIQTTADDVRIETEVLADNIKGDFTKKQDELESLIDELKLRLGEFTENTRDQLTGLAGLKEGSEEKFDSFNSRLETVVTDLEDLKEFKKETDLKLQEIWSFKTEIEEKTKAMDEKVESFNSKFDGIDEYKTEAALKLDDYKTENSAKFEELTRTIEEVRGKMEETLEERLKTAEDRLEEIQNRLEKDLIEKLDPIKAHLEELSGNLDTKLEPIRAEVQTAKTFIEEEMIKVKESWEKLDKTISDSGGAMEIAQKAKESLERMEKEISDAITRVESMIGTIGENTLKTDANVDKINLTIKLIDEARERIKGVQAPAVMPAVAASAPALFEEGLFLTHDEIAHTPDISELGFELDDLLQVMIKHTASDLHIKAGAPPTVRLEGELIPVGSSVLTEEDCKKLILSAMTPSMRSSLAKRKEVDFAYAIPDARFRVNAFLQKQSISAAFRLLWTEIPSLDELGLPPVLKKFCEYNHGLVLVTGPAGSGKSTTLASMVNYINEHYKRHVVTIEDPIEFIHSDKMSIITQREIGTDTESFPVALKQSLRQDPNVILIGEMRDPATIMTAVVAAETGHLVFSTLHTPNTIQAISRVIDVFTGDIQKQFRLLLSNTLRGIVSQRLLTRADDSGRVPATEVMVVTPTISSLILEEKTNSIYEYMVQGATDGMQTFTHSLVELYEQGVVTKEEAMYHADQPTEFRLAIEGHTTGTSSIQDDSLMSWL